MEESFSHKSFGQIRDYAEALTASRGAGCAHLMLINRHLDFRCLVFRGSFPKKMFRGQLTDAGSLEFLSAFLCWCEELPGMYQDLVTAVGKERAMQVQYLGRGAASVVYRDVANDGRECALKITAQLRPGVTEAETLRRLGGDGQLFPVLLEFQKGANWCLLRVAPVGEPRLADTVTLVSALRCLFQLHQRGWSHGDARWVNFVFVKERAILVDFATAMEEAAVSAMVEDVYRLLASVCNLDDSNVLSANARAMVTRAFLQRDERIVLQRLESELDKLYGAGCAQAVEESLENCAVMMNALRVGISRARVRALFLR